MHLLITVGLVFLISANLAQAAAVNCFTSPGQFWALEITFSPNGAIAINGHVHNVTLPTAHPCWTQMVNGSGILYPQGHEKHGTAEGVLVIHDVQCPEMVWRLRGRAGDVPLIYSGLMERQGAVRFEELLALEHCEIHP